MKATHRAQKTATSCRLFGPRNPDRSAASHIDLGLRLQHWLRDHRRSIDASVLADISFVFAMACSRGQTGRLFEQQVHLSLATAQDFPRARRLLLGRRCRQLKDIEKLTDTMITVCGPCPCYLAVRCPDLARLSTAASLLRGLVAHVLGQTSSLLDYVEVDGYLGPAAPALSNTVPTEQYLTVDEMKAVLTKLGCPNPAGMISDMQAEGLPFGQSYAFPDPAATPKGPLPLRHCSTDDVEESIVHGRHGVAADSLALPENTGHASHEDQASHEPKHQHMLSTATCSGVEESAVTFGAVGNCSISPESSLSPMWSSPLEEMD
eukprot:Skav217827  [mRNA]  locus=scaffold889:318051:319013:- [translate_table: standard]